MKDSKLDIFLSFVPVLAIVILLSLVIHFFGSSALDGGSQVCLIIGAAICSAIGVFRFKIGWTVFERKLKVGVSDVAVAIIILLLIGALSSMWILSGVVPMLIYYGLEIIHPSFFLVCTCIICSIVSVMTGSSWTTIATIGIALLGIGQAQGFHPGLIAGAIISGSYFGDKISPLSDTTVLASSMGGTPLFEHIRYMLITTTPTMIITLVIFTVIGLQHQVADSSDIQAYMSAIEGKFNMSIWLLIVPILTFVMIAKKFPAIVVLALSSFLGAIFALIFQMPVLLEIAPFGDSTASQAFTGVINGFYGSTSVSMSDPRVESLVSTRGMCGMLNTIFLILSAMCFGATMNASGNIRRITSLIVPLAKRRTSLVASTVGTGVLLNTLIADQYLSIILTSHIYRDIYEKKGYENRLLSRSMEDSCTVTSPLIPWSSCGMTQATILSVPTLTYLPYCFFNIISPLMSIFIAFIGYKIHKREPAPETEE